MLIRRTTVADPYYPLERELRNAVLLRPIGQPDGAWEGRDLDAHHYLALDDGVVVGCLLCWPVDGRPGVGQLMQMAVAPDRQGEGIGRQLVRRLLGDAVELGLHTITCHARADVVGFYERLGFVVFGEPFDEVGIAHRHMRIDAPSRTLRDHRGRTIDFGRQATDYDQHRPGFPPSFFAALSDRGYALPTQRALDLGTGTGSVAIGLAGMGLEVTGLDLSPDLLEVARTRAAGLPASFVVGRAEHTGLTERSSDLITAGQCWWWFDSDQAIAECRRLLVPGGRLLIASFSYLPLPGSVAGRTEALILEHNPGWPMAGWRGVHPEHVKALDVGGFVDVESFSYTEAVAFTHEGWRGRIRTCNGVGSALEPDQIDAFDQDLAALLASEFPGGISVLHRVFVATGVCP
jgi:SAM-dependent methyltransferase/predicted GNAT family N-acyltransferase